jgi:PIN domain nuclease of toxin-antitoxin system
MILLDTHVWIWAVNSPDKLSPAAIDTIESTPPGKCAISSISLWEFAMLSSGGRITLHVAPETWMAAAVDNAGIRVIDITAKIAVESCALPGEFHKDPADRIITATARMLNAPLLSKDESIREYPHVRTIW